MEIKKKENNEEENVFQTFLAEIPSGDTYKLNIKSRNPQKLQVKLLFLFKKFKISKKIKIILKNSFFMMNTISKEVIISFSSLEEFS